MSYCQIDRLLILISESCRRWFRIGLSVAGYGCDFAAENRTCGGERTANRFPVSAMSRRTFCKVEFHMVTMGHYGLDASEILTATSCPVIKL
jgi:hypothetical protein